jgi:4-hydroxyacetophenone monooxygenase
LTANAVISAVGIFSRPNVPAIPDLDAFGGRWCHTSRWPEDLDLTGKRVAVIGSGCSGYQLIPAIADTTAHTYLFQRTPSWVRPVPDYLSPTRPEVTWLDRNFPYHVNFARFRTAWLTRPEALMATYKADPDFHDDPDAASAANKQIRDASIAFMRSKFADRPDLMENMLPSVPPGSSRPVLVDRDCSVYDMLLRDDTTLVTEPIERVTAKGIVVGDGVEHPVDVIVLATGFNTNEHLSPMEVRGCSSRLLAELWAEDGPRAYLGAMVPGFPNFFMLYGPNTNGLGGLGVVEFEEMIVRFALQCLASLILEGRDAVDVRSDAYSRFNEQQDRADAVQVYNFDKRVQSYYTSRYGRSVTNGALDIRLLWNWLRDPLRDPSTTGDPTIEERLADVSADLADIAGFVEPYIGKDLVVS